MKRALRGTLCIGCSLQDDEAPGETSAASPEPESESIISSDTAEGPNFAALIGTLALIAVGTFSSQDGPLTAEPLAVNEKVMAFVQKDRRYMANRPDAYPFPIKPDYIKEKLEGGQAEGDAYRGDVIEKLGSSP